MGIAGLASMHAFQRCNIFHIDPTFSRNWNATKGLVFLVVDIYLLRQKVFTLVYPLLVRSSGGSRQVGPRTVESRWGGHWTINLTESNRNNSMQLVGVYPPTSVPTHPPVYQPTHQPTHPPVYPLTFLVLLFHISSDTLISPAKQIYEQWDFTQIYVFFSSRLFPRILIPECFRSWVEHLFTCSFLQPTKCPTFDLKNLFTHLKLEFP